MRRTNYKVWAAAERLTLVSVSGDNNYSQLIFSTPAVPSVLLQTHIQTLLSKERQSVVVMLY